MRFPVILVAAFIAASSLSSAQVTGNPSGEHGVVYNIQFQVLDQSAQPVKNVLVDLYNFSGIKLMGAMTNGEGRAIFRMSPGSYTIATKGNDIEDSSVTFRVEELDGDRIEQLNVKRKAAIENAAPGGLITAAMMAIPQKARAEFQKGTARLAEQKNKEARGYFSKAVALYPRYAEALNGLGVVSLREGDTNAAKGFFEQAISADDQHPTAYVNLARLHIFRKEAASALPLLKKATSLAPADTDALAQLSFAQFATGDCPAAIETSARVHRSPHHGAELAHFVAGACFETQNDYAKAESEYNTYLEEAPNGRYAQKVRIVLQQLKAAR